jgi:hypothetical protein
MMRRFGWVLIALLAGCASSVPSPVEDRSGGNKPAPAAVSAPPAAPAPSQDPITACLDSGGTWVTPAAGAGAGGRCEMPKPR